MNTPKVGSIWKHKNGNVYKVLMICNEEALPERRDEYPITIVYSGENNKIWSRTLEHWEGSFEPLSDNIIAYLESEVKRLKLHNKLLESSLRQTNDRLKEVQKAYQDDVEKKS